MIGVACHQLGRNEQGRDLVVSDIHGMVELLDAALDRLRFDPAVDRLIAVGDLVDKGPASQRAVRLLDEPWFHCVMGNHDLAAILNILAGDGPVSASESWELRLPAERWLQALSAREDHEVLARLGALPWTVEVETRVGLVGIVHAEVPADCQTWAALKSGVLRALKGEMLFNTLSPVVRGRRLLEAIKAGEASTSDDASLTLPDVAHVIHGHTIRDGFRPWRMGNRWHIDSGAFLTQPEWRRVREQAGGGEPGLTIVDIEDPATPL